MQSYPMQYQNQPLQPQPGVVYPGSSSAPQCQPPPTGVSYPEANPPQPYQPPPPGNVKAKPRKLIKLLLRLRLINIDF